MPVLIQYIRRLAGKNYQKGGQKLLLFYKILNGDAPDYLADLVPPTVSETSSYNLRNNQNISQQTSRLSLHQDSFLPATIYLWNALDPEIRQ